MTKPATVYPRGGEGVADLVFVRPLQWNPFDQHRLVAQLIDDRYLAGNYECDEEEHPCYAVVTGITLSGRRYVEQLETEHSSGTATGKLKKWAKYGLVYLGGVL